MEEIYMFIELTGLSLMGFERKTGGQFKKRHSCKNMIMKWKYDADAGKYHEVAVTCGEQLWQPDISRKNYRKAMS